MGVPVFSPAKINLFLAVTGRRADGFHDLVSVVAPLDFGDTLEAEPKPGGTEPRFTLEADSADVPLDGSNLILKAAAAFVAATGWTGGAHFKLQKRIPVGAGLGGGSSNAVAALRGLNQLAGTPLAPERLAEIAATLGSDCALFVSGAPVIMRGRGDRLEPLPPGALARLHGRRVVVFKPSFGVSTPWAYQRMIARGGDYVPADLAEQRVAQWCVGTDPLEALIGNNMEPAVFEKYLALPVLLARLRRDFGLPVGMSGSGSACFAVLTSAEREPVERLTHAIREAWGPATFVQEARLA